VPAGGSIPSWKQRTKRQWLAWITTRLRWVLGARYLTLFQLIIARRRQEGFPFRLRPWRRFIRGRSDTGSEFVLSCEQHAAAHTCIGPSRTVPA
jgi:hypothetical protein